jgi:hypothetical protein
MRTIYFFIRNNPFQFKAAAILTVCWDLAVLTQRIIYKAEPPISARHGGTHDGGEDDEEARGLRIGSGGHG